MGSKRNFDQQMSLSCYNERLGSEDYEQEAHLPDRMTVRMDMMICLMITQPGAVRTDYELLRHQLTTLQLRIWKRIADKGRRHTEFEAPAHMLIMRCASRERSSVVNMCQGRIDEITKASALASRRTTLAASIQSYSGLLM